MNNDNPDKKPAEDISSALDTEISNQFLGFSILKKTQTIKNFFDGAPVEIFSSYYEKNIRTEMTTGNLRATLMAENKKLKSFLSSTNDIMIDIKSYDDMIKKIFDFYLNLECLSYNHAKKLGLANKEIFRQGKIQILETTRELINIFFFTLIQKNVSNKKIYDDITLYLSLYFKIYFISHYFIETLNNFQLSPERKKELLINYHFLKIHAFCYITYHTYSNEINETNRIKRWCTQHLSEISKEILESNILSELKKKSVLFFLKTILFLNTSPSFDLTELLDLTNNLFDTNFFESMIREAKNDKLQDWTIAFPFIFSLKLYHHLLIMIVKCSEKNIGIIPILLTTDAGKRFLSAGSLLFLTMAEQNASEHNIPLDDPDTMMFLSYDDPCIYLFLALGTFFDKIPEMFIQPSKKIEEKNKNSPKKTNKVQSVPSTTAEIPKLEEKITNTTSILAETESKPTKKEIRDQKKQAKIMKAFAKHLKRLEALGPDFNQQRKPPEPAVEFQGFRYKKIDNADIPMYACVTPEIKEVIISLLKNKGEAKTTDFKIIRPSGGQGIKKLSDLEKNKVSHLGEGYRYKLKFLGNGGEIRLLGRIVQNKEYPGKVFILFDQIVDHELKLMMKSKNTSVSYSLRNTLLEEQHRQDSSSTCSTISEESENKSSTQQNISFTS